MIRYYQPRKCYHDDNVIMIIIYRRIFLITRHCEQVNVS